LTYAAGMALPFLLLTLSLHRLQSWLRKLLPYTRRIQVASGVLMVVLGIMIYTNSFVLLNSYFDWGFSVHGAAGRLLDRFDTVHRRAGNLGLRDGAGHGVAGAGHG